MGIAAPTAVLLFVNSYAGMILGFLLLIVMWSRVHLQRHSLAQVIAGAVLGLIFTGIQIYLIRIFF
ncbi:phosphatase PAP2 family protein [uncultured Methanoregula sp.]|uniref:phosphatase PAP2 family protein n=1 Tax=uncultured Methanoregula sp. TaxID=1005933 RepID=UPI002AAB52D8|nr:phosphatase PAP2 family protein [uncultured Methanoregula sp.]